MPILERPHYPGADAAGARSGCHLDELDLQAFVAEIGDVCAIWVDAAGVVQLDPRNFDAIFQKLHKPRVVHEVADAVPPVRVLIADRRIEWWCPRVPVHTAAAEINRARLTPRSLRAVQGKS